MRLFEAIVNANHRALGGDSRAGLNPSGFADALPVVALTCIDPRLNPLLPEVLGVPEEDFIWLRNAGNIIFDPLSSMMRTLALACAIKGGREIAVIGHTDCRVRQTSVDQLIENFRALGINRASLPDNLVEFFGLFASERQNVLNGVNQIRQSPLISPRIPVHGLMVDIESGRLEWLVNGYEQVATSSTPPSVAAHIEKPKEPLEISFGPVELKIPELKIGELTLDPQKWLSEIQVVSSKAHDLIQKIHPPAAPPVVEKPKAPSPPTIPLPPPIPPMKHVIRSKK